MLWTSMSNQQENLYHNVFGTSLGVASFVDVAFATKHPKEGDVWLLPIEQLIRCLAKELLKE